MFQDWEDWLQGRMFQLKGRRFQLREEGSNSERNVLTPRKNVPAQRMHVLTKRRNVPTQRRMFWNILPWVGTFIFGSEHSSFRLEHSSLEPKLSSLSWNILLWSQNLLPLGWNILPWSQCVVLGHSWFSFRYADVSGRAIFWGRPKVFSKNSIENLIFDT